MEAVQSGEFQSLKLHEIFQEQKDLREILVEEEFLGKVYEIFWGSGLPLENENVKIEKG